MINFKQRELSQMLFDKLKLQYPELEMVDIIESPENPNHIWINLVMPDDENREVEVYEEAGKISNDILMEYGYLIIISAASKKEGILA